MASFSGFDPAALGFLRDLGAHNDRAWFEAHRADYEGLVLGPARELVVALGGRLARLAPGVHADPRVNGSILRLNRDARFSADKRPYKTHLDLWLWEGDGPSRGCSGASSCGSRRIASGTAPACTISTRRRSRRTARPSTIRSVGRSSCGR